MELLIKSTIDGTMQPSLFYEAKGKNRPLLVALHTWSYDRFVQEKKALPIAKEYDFNLLLPEFRGPNKRHNPKCLEACASPLAKQDICDAIDYVLSFGNIDKDNVFLMGESGGGHMALMMAGYRPEYFKAVAAVVPISDLKKWYDDNENYRDDIDACCNEDVEEMKKRSPISYTESIAKANLKIFHGKYDPCVCVEQSLILYNKIMSENPRSKVYLDIFDGGHETDVFSVMHWFMSQYEKESLSKVTG